MPKLSPDTPFLHPGAVVVNSTFGGWCEVGDDARVLNSDFGDYAYCERLSDIANTTVGKFANIAAMTRIGPTDHPYANAAQHHFLYRSSYYWPDEADDLDLGRPLKPTSERWSGVGTRWSQPCAIEKKSWDPKA